jgi:hypothetical protein
MFLLYFLEMDFSRYDSMKRNIVDLTGIDGHDAKVKAAADPPTRKSRRVTTDIGWVRVSLYRCAPLCPVAISNPTHCVSMVSHFPRTGQEVEP